MRTRSRTVSSILQSLALFASLLLGVNSSVQAEPGSTAPSWADAFNSAEKVTLTDSHVERFIAATKELKAQNFDYEMPDDSGTANWSEAFRQNKQLNSIIQKHGFRDGAAFENTVYSIVAGIANMEMEANRPEIEEAKAQLAQMKDQMPAETYAMLEQQMLGITQMFSDQPAGNVDVVRKYRQQLEALDSDD